jgi:hypothetical protein
VYKALQLLEWLELDVDTQASPEARKLARTLHEFDQYIRTNQSSIPNYGDRYRNEEAISSAVAESTVNQIVSRRFVKKQQMRWTRRGAHLLLQLRTRVLDDTLLATFQRWYPGMEADESHQDLRRLRVERCLSFVSGSSVFLRREAWRGRLQAQLAWWRFFAHITRNVVGVPTRALCVWRPHGYRRCSVPGCARRYVR